MGCDCALALRGSGARVFVLGYADMGYDCAALRGSGARVSVCGYADMGKDCVLALLGWYLCSLPSSVTATWARIALSLSLVWCSCSFLSWRIDSSLGLLIQLTIEIVQLQPIDKVFDVSVVQVPR